MSNGNRLRAWWRFALMVLMAGCFYALFGVAPISAQTRAEEADSPICRLGVNVNSAHGEPPIDGFDTAPLRLGWYIDYRALTAPPRPQGMSYAPMIRLRQTGPDSYSAFPSGQALNDAIKAHSGQEAHWYVGNEPDRILYQDDIMPEVYATAYHELRAQIKALDPTAKVIAGSIVQATDVRMDYLDLILESHQEQYGEAMAVDGWSIHGFVLREASCEVYPPSQCWGADIPPGVDATEGLLIGVQDNDDFDIFTENVVRMREWMADNGYRNTPLYLSEYGVLMPAGRFNPDFTPERVNAFMTKSFDYLLRDGVDEEIGYPPDGNRLVQKLSWYSLSDNTDFNGFLFDLNNGRQLSAMGAHFANEAAALGDDLDFAPLSLTTHSPIIILGPEDNRRALLIVGVDVANAGHNLVAESAPLRLYDGDPDNGGVALTDGAVAVSGCGAQARALIAITIPWDGESEESLPDSLDLHVSVNPDGSVAEVDTTNNRLARTLALADMPVTTLDIIGFLPVVSR